MLAEKMLAYQRKQCAVVSLSEGGVVVGLQIARKIHASLFLLTTESIRLPGEPEPIATITSAGTFTYNKGGYTTGELEELNVDYHGLIEERRYEAFQKLNRVSKDEGEIPKTLLKDHTVILVSDGFKNGLSLDVAADFLKPVRTKGLAVAVPIASVPAVDQMHLLADEIFCLSVIEDFMNVDHYYENNQLPSRQEIVKMTEQAPLTWENQPSPPSASGSE